MLRRSRKATAGIVAGVGALAAIAVIAGGGLASADADNDKITPKVANGEDAPDGAYPFTVKPANHLQTGQFKAKKQNGKLLKVTGYKPSPDTSSCPYDSGGPFVLETDSGPRLVSVESGGPDCPHSGLEDTARIDTNTDWIDQNIV
ncbi:hypothetical protein [Stackebrandtia nassauensis]|uniref:Uncharacterized protein n=1 Tax=Stackebrandtia nassauensis (strain DSM 44728 / CIP 108903 / NRRL B-16338 / NBRC 102104 / LLR-40K-21) TaxID=446470 RepID=D3PUK1_STANL|nr:hypothetical protein [Stackebrandtia nassauensis]ADD43014.1 hypothetical protein Snas_3348 [Stackebrandtia nassauensis DSM 44728]